MLHRTARFLIIAALMFSIGLHWVVLQSVAWASMVVTYTVQEGSLLEGVSQTFDDSHPCELCYTIKESRKSEKKAPERTDSKQKMDLALPVAGRIVLTPPTSVLATPADFPSAVARSICPPKPPPRSERCSLSLG